MHNIDFDPITHRVSMSLETFLGVIRDAAAIPAPADAEGLTCGNCQEPIRQAGQHRDGNNYACQKRYQDAEKKR